MSSSPTFQPSRRIVTGHNAEAKATIKYDSMVETQQMAHGNVHAATLWTNNEFPADPNSSDDKGLIKTGLVNDGSLIRFVDLPPRSTGSLHRTISVDYIIILKGKIVLTLDDGSRTTLTEGDTVIQQATAHGWDNETDEWVRLLCVLIKAHNPIAGGRTLESNVHFEI